VTAAADAIVSLADERGLAMFQDVRKRVAYSPQLVATISAYESRLRAKLSPAKARADGPPN
jgi:hypothetical protein